MCPYMTLCPKYTTVFKSSVQVCNCLQIQCPSTQLSPKVVCHYATVTKFRVHLRNCHQNMGTFWPLGSPREPPRPSRTEVRKRVDFGHFLRSILGAILEPFSYPVPVNCRPFFGPRFETASEAPLETLRASKCLYFGDSCVGAP